MKRLVIVYNPRSSGFKVVDAEVLSKAPKEFTRFEVFDTDVDDNAEKLSKVIEDGDLVIAAGGDGTATIAVNGVLLSGREAKLAVLGYGNFNDVARTFGMKSIEQVLSNLESEKVFPLEAVVDGRHWRFAVAYFTIGMFAEACKAFDQKDTREKLRKRGGGMVMSLGVVVRWWIRERKRRFLPRSYSLNGSLVKDSTDYVAVNGPSMAKVMRGRRWYRGKEFRSETGNLGNFFGLMRVMIPSVLWKVPGKMSRGDVLEFERPASVEIQGEGEYTRLEGVEKIEIRKADRFIEVISNFK